MKVAEQQVEFVDEAQMLVRMPGLTHARLRRALQLLHAAEQLQAEEAEQRRPELLRIMTVAQVQALPAASVAQARRVAALREWLLATPYETVSSLREATGKSRDNLHVWLSRQRDAHRLFTVSHENTTVVPAFQFNGEYQPRAALRPVLQVLDQAGLSEWGLWSWFCTASGWLDGEVAAEVLEREPGLVQWAATRYVESLAPQAEIQQTRAGGEDRAAESESASAAPDRPTVVRGRRATNKDKSALAVEVVRTARVKGAQATSRSAGTTEALPAAAPDTTPPRKRARKQAPQA